MISPLKEIDAVVRCLELGAEEYLIKPFNSVIFKTRITAAIEKKEFAGQGKSYLEQLKVEKGRSGKSIAQFVPALYRRASKAREKPTSSKDFQMVTVIFIDIVNFSHLTELVSPEELIKILNIIFSAIDHLTDRYYLEKIKTVWRCLHGCMRSSDCKSASRRTRRQLCPRRQ